MNKYLSTLFALQPPGKALSTDPESLWGRLLDGLAAEPERVDRRIFDLLREMDPRQAVETLPEWESLCGLIPRTGATLTERRADVVTQLTGLGEQTIPFYERMAALLGYTVTITEYRPFQCGLSRCGDGLWGGHDVRFIWSVIIAGQRVIRFLTGGSQCRDALAQWPDHSDLIRLFERIKPAHTICIYGVSTQ